MKLKKIPYYLLLILLTAGASLILGFMSFGGMYALWPILPLALGAFGLSVIYEAEIYFQNIKAALNKLFFKRDYLPRHLANERLATAVAKADGKADCPQFFKDYKAQLLLLAEFDHQTLDKINRKRKKKIKKTLSDMEKWFALQLFSSRTDDENETAGYKNELLHWLALNGQEKSEALLKKRSTLFTAVKWFSVLSATFMALGTSYLLMGQIVTIPLLASIPFAFLPPVVIPMAIVAGVAWGLLTYNAITDMINNDTLKKWYRKLRDNFREGITARNVIITLSALTLVGLAIALTVCTAGTWWTIAKNTQPLFAFMGKMPAFIMGILNPLITGIAAIFFNVENTFETLELIDQELQEKENIFKRGWRRLREGVVSLIRREHIAQLINLPRILLFLTFTPLKIVLFLTHLAAIAVTADRVPGIPEIASAILGFISEFFEDLHYFSGHDHHAHDHHAHEHDHHDEHEDPAHHARHHLKHLLKERLIPGAGHSHDNDIPTKLLTFIFTPVIALSVAWDYLASQYNHDQTRRWGSFKAAWNSYWGKNTNRDFNVPDELCAPASNEWKLEQTLYRIDRFKQKHLNKVVIGKDIAIEKSLMLTDLQDHLRNQDEGIEETLALEAQRFGYSRARFFRSGKTDTELFLETLPERVGLEPAAVA